MIRIRINDYITDYKVNLEYAETQLDRARRKIARIVTTETTQKDLDRKAKKIGRALKMVQEVLAEPLK
jgi:hypothetical protein